MTVNYVDSVLVKPLRWTLQMFGRPADYTAQGGASGSLVAYVRGVRAQDLFASAVQADLAAVVDAGEFAAKIGPTPRRFDRLRTMSLTYSVEQWRGSPTDDDPVFFKLLLRGGQQ
jgi:hypothetical protein